MHSLVWLGSPPIGLLSQPKERLESSGRQHTLSSFLFFLCGLHSSSRLLIIFLPSLSSLHFLFVTRWPPPSSFSSPPTHPPTYPPVSIVSALKQGSLGGWVGFFGACNSTALLSTFACSQTPLLRPSFPSYPLHPLSLPPSGPPSPHPHSFHQQAMR